MLAPQIEKFYFELANPLVTSALCLVHQRFSTNTFPSWKLAHPYRYVAHNGEINTIRGNISWMNARQSVLESPLLRRPDRQALSRSSCPAAATRLRWTTPSSFSYQSGRSLPHVMAMLIPEAWAGNPDMDEDKRAFYEYHASLMEPWDGPAAIAFTDGRVIGATLDRNGLRPGRYIVTKDDLVVLASEAGVLDVPAEDVRKKGRLQPGRMFLVDTVQQRIISDAEIKKQLAAPPALRRLAQAAAGHAWIMLPEPSRVIASNPETLLRRQRAYGYSEEDLRMLLAPMGADGARADRLHGHRCAAGLPLRPSPAALQLLQAALRAGHQSAHRSHPRRAGDVAHQLHRHRAQHSGRGAGKLPHPQAAASHPDQPRSGKAAPRLLRRSAGHHAAGALPRRGWRGAASSTRSTI